MNKKIILAEASFFVPVEKVLFDHSRMRRSLETATSDKYSGKQNDFATVWKMLLEDPNVKLKDLPDKMEIGYFVTLRWKDENGKTLGGKTVQLSNKAEFDELRKMVVAAGGKK